MMTTFFKAFGLRWKNICCVCTDGVPTMLNSQSSFVKKVKKLALEAQGTHCFIHRYALASKTLPTAQQKVFNLAKEL